MTLPKVASLLVIIAAVFALLILGKSLLIPAVIALLVWYIINALGHWIGELKPFKKFLPGWARIVVSTLIIALVLLIVGGLVAESARGMVNSLPRYEGNVGYLIERLGTAFDFDTSGFFRKSESGKMLNILEGAKNLLAQVSLSTLISSILNTLSGITGNAFLITIYVLFLLLEQAVFPKKIWALFPDEEQHARVQGVFTRINNAIRTYFSVKLTLNLISAIACYFVMVLVGLDFAIFWAFLIFILNFIPSIGALAATIFPSLLAIVQFETLTPFVVILIGVGAIQVIVANLLEPRMMGSSLNISSLAVIVALTMWGALWGIIGMILSVPITVVMMIIFAEFPATRPIAILLSVNGKVFSGLEEIQHSSTGKVSE